MGVAGAAHGSTPDAARGSIPRTSNHPRQKHRTRRAASHALRFQIRALPGFRLQRHPGALRSKYEEEYRHVAVGNLSHRGRLDRAPRDLAGTTEHRCADPRTCRRDLRVDREVSWR